jgi:hypothetical protein
MDIGGTMPSFEFCYINEDGSLACTLAACFADEAHAKKFARATKLGDLKSYEVWLGERLVYEQLDAEAQDLSRGLWVAA